MIANFNSKDVGSMKKHTLLMIFSVLLLTVVQPAATHADFMTGNLLLSGDGESFDYHDQSFSTSDGLVITFDFSTWSSAYMADGFALTLFDADTALPEIGGRGGSLSYANRTNTDGLAGGVLGIGFDAHGNFSDGTEGRNGGIGRTVNSIALRGSMGSTRQDGYEYIAGTGSLSDFMNNNRASSQDDALTRTVRITITTNELVSVDWKIESEQHWTTLIDAADATAQMDLPAEIKIGITSSLNTGMNVEVGNMSIQAIPEPAAVTLILGSGIGLLLIRRIF